MRREIDLELCVGSPVSGVVLELVAERQVLLNVRRTQAGSVQMMRRKVARGLRKTLLAGRTVLGLGGSGSGAPGVGDRSGFRPIRRVDPSGEREVANVLAVAGTRVNHRRLTTVTVQAEPDVLAGLDQLRTEQLIEEATEEADIRAQPTLRRLRRVSFSPFAVPRDGEGDRLSSGKRPVSLIIRGAST